MATRRSTRVRKATRTAEDDAEVRPAKQAKIDEMLGADDSAAGDHHDDADGAMESESSKEKSSKGSFNFEMEKFGDLIVYHSCDEKANPSGSEKIAGFDLDSTLIVTASGNVHPKTHTDWKLIYSKNVMQKKLQQLVDDGYKLMIFSNQKAISKNKPSPAQFKQKLQGVMQAIGGPMFSYALVAIGSGKERKPQCEMWEFMERQLNAGVQVNREESIYIGDAAGRPEGWKAGHKKDFAASDRKFALNLGVQFKTPEEFFLDEAPASFSLDGFDPKTVEGQDVTADAVKAILFPNGEKPAQELIVMVGYPASGKSSVYRDVFGPMGYKHVNQDTLKTAAKCEKFLKETLSNGESAVVDNTNPTKAKRKVWLKIAKDNGVSARCVWMTAPQELAEHLNIVREHLPDEYQKSHVPGIVYGKFKKEFEEPSEAEGFSEVIQLDFKPRFYSDAHKELFFKYT